VSSVVSSAGPFAVRCDLILASTFWSTVGTVAIATVAVAVANVIFLGVNARATRQHELRMAREAIQQRRLEDTYLAVVTLMHREGVLAQSLLDPVEGLAPIGDLEVSEMVGRVRTFGSNKVIEETERWAALIGDVNNARATGVGALATAIAALRAQEAVVRATLRKELTFEDPAG
jgi:hypothetical protein